MTSPHRPASHGIPRPRVWAPLHYSGFATLFIGYSVSSLGNGMSAVAVAWLAIALAHGHGAGLLIGEAVAAYTLPGVLVALGASRVLKRLDPRLIILVDAIFRAVPLALIAGLALTDTLSPILYVSLLGCSSLFGLLGIAGDLAATTELLPSELYVAANSLNSVASFSASIGGPAVAGVLTATVGPGLVFAIDAATYVLLAGAVLASRRYQPPTPVVKSSSAGIRDGLRALWNFPALGAITLLCVIFYGLYGPVEVALPLYVSSVLHASASVLGGYWTVFALGATLGALGATSIHRFGLWRMTIAAVAAWGVCLIPFGFTTSVVIGFIAMSVGGLVYGPFIPLKKTIIQRSARRELLTQVAAASGVFTVSASPVGAALGGPLVAALGARATLAFSGLATVTTALVAVAVLLVYRRRTRKLSGDQ
ncbi:MAG: MFS transporter [Ferrimicrobium sp.]